jgi:putative SOS response-associated peptidase YedK
MGEVWMCGRFAQFNPVDLLKARFDISETACDVTPSYNIAPSQDVPVLIRIPEKGNRFGKIRWGIENRFIKDGKKPPLVINARAEGIWDKPMFRASFKTKRCLILSDGYYEWTREGNVKKPWFIHPFDGNPFGFAGIWQIMETGEGIRQTACVIITREAVGPVREIHTRMPVIVPSSSVNTWLDNESDGEICRSILEDGFVSDLDFYRVSDKMNSASFNHPSCIERVVDMPVIPPL